MGTKRVLQLRLLADDGADNNPDPSLGAVSKAVATSEPMPHELGGGHPSDDVATTDPYGLADDCGEAQTQEGTLSVEKEQSAVWYRNMKEVAAAKEGERKAGHESHGAAVTNASEASSVAHNGQILDAQSVYALLPSPQTLICGTAADNAGEDESTVDNSGDTECIPGAGANMSAVETIDLLDSDAEIPATAHTGTHHLLPNVLALRTQTLRELLTKGVCAPTCLAYPALVKKLRYRLTEMLRVSTATSSLPVVAPHTVAKASSARKSSTAFMAKQAEVEGLPACTPSAGYCSPAAPLVLLRAYASQDRWVGVREHAVVFEDDAVQYPSWTLTPIKEIGGVAAEVPKLNLVSLWLLVALRGHYAVNATMDLLRDLGAVCIPARYRCDLLQYLLGLSPTCELLISEEDMSNLPCPRPTQLQRPLAHAEHLPPLDMLHLGQLPGQRFVKSICTASTKARRRHITRGALRAQPMGGHIPTETRWGRLRRDVTRNKLWPTISSGAAAGPVNGPVAALARNKVADAVWRKMRAEAAVHRVEGEEAVVASMLGQCEASLSIAMRDLAAAKERAARLRAAYCGLELSSSCRLPLHQDAKRRRLHTCSIENMCTAEDAPQ